MMKKLLCTLLIAVFAIGSIHAQFGTVSGGSPLKVITPMSSTSPGINTPDTDDGTNMGTTTIGAPITQTFTFTTITSGTYLISTTPIVGSPDFVVNSPTPGVINTLGGTSTFTVTFDPAIGGTQIATIHVRAMKLAPPAAPVLENYYFQVQGTSGAPSPNLVVTGDDSLAIPNGQFSSAGDNTDFGQAVAGVETVTRQFTITNTGSAPLDVYSIDFAAPPGVYYSIILPPSTTFPLTLASGFSLTYNVEFSPTVALSPLNELIAITSNDPASFGYFYYQVIGEGIAAAPDMNVTGLGQQVADGSAASSTNGTDFGDVDINTLGGFSRTFTIENKGTSDLLLTNTPKVVIGGTNPTDFTVTASPSSPIAANASTTFTIKFEPSSDGPKDATVTINNNSSATGESPYNFAISGNATDVATTGQLLITQYYEGTGTGDQWIEVKNITGGTITGGTFNLCLYQDGFTVLGNISTQGPQFSTPIPTLGAGDVHIFYNTTGPGGIPAAPTAGNLGGLPINRTPSDACKFTGNDVILISSIVGSGTYDARIDIMGVVPNSGNPPNWGQNKSFIKGCGTSELPTQTFAVATGGAGGGLLVTDYLQVSLEEVNNADSQSNMALGTQKFGSTIWTTSWSNGVPDKTRVAVVSDTYTAVNGSMAACDLTVTGTIDMDGGTTNYVGVNRSFTNTGTVIIGDQESLYTVNTLDQTGIGNTPVTISGNITKKETTTSLTNKGDYTYWSSPTVNTSTATVFPDPVYNQGRIYTWDQAAINVDGLGGNQFLGEWISADSQTMEKAKGYISQGPVAGTYPGTATVSFTGAPRVDNVSIPLVFNNNANSFDDLNLVGNPYPSAIDADEFIDLANNLTAISGTLYFWSHTTPNNGSTTGEQYAYADYSLYNLTGGTSDGSSSGSPAPTSKIGSGQGFMVSSINDGKSVTFSDQMRLRTQVGVQVFRGTDTKNSIATENEKDRIWLNAKSSKGGAASQILVAFLPNATDGNDRGYDGTKISEGWINLYSKIDTIKYGIQALNSFDTDKKVPLAFQTYIDETDISYTIGIDRFEGIINDNDVYLFDNELNITHDLKQSDYSFTAVTGSHDNRFTLQFTKATLGVDDLDLINDFVVVNEENSLLVKSKTIVRELKVYDVTGRMLVNMLPNESEFRINTSSIRKGTVLILNTTFENGTEISKKAIKY